MMNKRYFYYLTVYPTTLLAVAFCSYYLLLRPQLRSIDFITRDRSHLSLTPVKFTKIYQHQVNAQNPADIVMAEHASKHLLLRRLHVSPHTFTCTYLSSFASTLHFLNLLSNTPSSCNQLSIHKTKDNPWLLTRLACKNA